MEEEWIKDGQIEDILDRVDRIDGKGFRVMKNQLVGRENSPVLWCVTRIK